MRLASEKKVWWRSGARIWRSTIWRLADTGWQHCDSVGFRKILVAGIEVGLVAAGLGDARLEMVRDDGGGHAAEVFQGAHVGADPVGDTLRPRRLAVGVIRESQHGDEDLRTPNLARRRIDHLHGLAGVIDEELVARRVRLAQHGVLRADPGPVQIAEAAVAVAVLARRPVLLPQQLQGHALAA